ncbi:MAG: hypothetical protein B6A08_02930 [Sorangiineae bacterium NIC37A_2]|jgi:hypothetical protein|nr:MAG: hypothetical protein B6A08_02930 [Sorangiineae bacterium NIC37A_2]
MSFLSSLGPMSFGLAASLLLLGCSDCTLCGKTFAEENCAALPGSVVPSRLGTGTFTGQGTSSERYQTEFVSRNGVPYVLITNGWGPKFESHTISWLGTSFSIDTMQGDAGDRGEPASYPSVFCGQYSVPEVPDCGLPAAIDSLSSIKTGMRWNCDPTENAGYNVAYDIWVGNGSQLQTFLMVWLRDPPRFSPAGSRKFTSVEVQGLPGRWHIVQGTVNGLPIVNWVRAEGQDLSELEFDVMDILRDAAARGITYPGTHINSVAIGFEVWQGPVAGLAVSDFYVDVEKK